MGRRHIYQSVGGVTDIREINRKIRKEVAKAKTRAQLTELHKRSMYLVTLCHAPAWKEAFRGKIAKMKKAAQEEFTKTARAINRRAEKLGLRADYDTKWGPGR